MKNFIIIFFVPLLAQEPKQTLELTYDSELNIKSIENYIENKGDVKVLNSLILRSLQSQIVNRDWEIADTILNHYISLIDDYYDNYDLNYIEEIRRLVQQKTDDIYNVNFINKSVNTNNNETDPLLIDFEDERYLYFTRKPRIEESNDEDIFVGLEKKNFVFSDIVPLPFNTKGKPEAVSYVSAKEPITLIYYGHYGSDLRGNLYISTYNNNWSEPVKLSFPVNTNNFELDGILYEEEYILFASDRPDHNNYNPKGKLYNGDYWGNSDLYVSKRLDFNEWSKPINLGNIINTKYGERTPWLSRDGLTLYFSSDGHPGFGRMDVFKSTRTDKSDWTSWSVPQNLGKNINNAFNDIGYSIYENKDFNMQFAFFSTSSNSIVDDYDIAYVQLSKENSPLDKPLILNGNVKGKDGPIADLAMVAEDKKTGKKLGEVKTDKDGNYNLPIDKDSDPNIYPKTDDFIPQTKPIDNPLIKKGSGSDDSAFNQAPRKNDGALDLKKIEEDWNNYLKKDGIEKPPGFGLDKNGVLIPPLSDETPSISDLDNYYEKYEDDLRKNKYSFSDGLYRYLEPINFDLKEPATECETNLSILNTINFDSKSSILSDQSQFELNRVSNYLKKNENYFMLVIGHTDSDSTKTYNKKLSDQRSKSVKDYLVSKGCQDYQFLTIGKGEDMLLTDESTPYLKRKNRRVEFCINTKEFPKEFKSRDYR